MRKAGNRLRITAQLVEAATGNHIWAERYDRELADIFAVHCEITERVAGAIEPELYAAEHFRSQRKPPESLDAWECVIRALSHIGQVTRAGVVEAEALCRRAIAIAPGYAQAHGPARPGADAPARSSQVTSKAFFWRRAPRRGWRSSSTSGIPGHM